MIDEVREGCLIEEVWHRLKRKGFSSSRERNRKEKNEGGQRDDDQTR